LKTIISESLNLPSKSSFVTEKPFSNSSMMEISEQQKLTRYGGKNLGLQKKILKIQQKEYINLAILIKGTATDSKETPQGPFLGVDEMA
jgi:hypothetical protein